MSIEPTNIVDEAESPATATDKTPEEIKVVGEKVVESSTVVAVEVEVDKETPSQQETAEEEQQEQINPPTKKLCGVCNKDEGKYKCTRCYLPYCSITCSKQHNINHPPDVPKPILSPEPSPIITGKRVPGTLSAANKNFKGPFAALDTAPELSLLFTKYPNLPSVLSEIESSTLPPTDEYTSSGLPTKIHKGGKEKQQPWSSDRGLAKGVEALKQARNSDGRDGEAVRAYGRLVLQILGKEEGGLTTEEVIQKELQEENQRIVEQLLNGDIG